MDGRVPPCVAPLLSRRSGVTAGGCRDVACVYGCWRVRVQSTASRRRAIGGASVTVRFQLDFSRSEARVVCESNKHLTIPALSGPLPPADSKTFKKPRRPFEKERLDNELKVVGEYGLRNKRELWRVQFALNKLRNASRVLLTLDEKDPKRIFEGEAIMRRMYRYGLLVRYAAVDGAL